ncbi:ELAV-like protein 3 isoform X2 [Paramacrobiotus metropolitanus]|uniref:ELAV-like protein 3 isoform X2 n=1 Tax=Paramacrobiotus metropolitanus TaxID=2943436 RepID=UPI002445A590|nr:ELAV-like protein 3 isoform X2 [Paramacrobiotus metropolitanus]
METDDGHGESRTNLIFLYLPQEWRDQELRAASKPFGDITSCRVVRDKSTGNSLGYGFVDFRHQQSAEKAIEKLNGMRISNKTIKVSRARPRREEIKNANLYVRGLPTTWYEGEISEYFSKLGKVISVRILKEAVTGHSKGVGFVRFNTAAEAASARKLLNSRQIDGHTLLVDFSHRSANSESESSTVEHENVQCDISLHCGNAYQPYPAYTQLENPASSPAGMIVTHGGDAGFGLVYPSAFGIYNSTVNNLVPYAPMGINMHSVQNAPSYAQIAPSFTDPVFPSPSVVQFVGDPVSLYVGNLDESVTPEDLRELFARYGTTVSNVELLLRKTSRNYRASSYGMKYSFVELLNSSEADRVIEALHGCKWRGRDIVVRRKTTLKQNPRFRTR